MKHKRILGLVMLLLAGVLTLAGCTNPPAVQTGNVSDYTVKLYFVNEEVVTTGDASLESLMPAEVVTLSATPGAIQLAAIEALKTVPAKEHYGTTLTKALKINAVYTKDATAYVDLSRENLSGSSTQETLLISQIVKTLRESFPEIAQVQFLVDGKVAESLMGHIAADKPFTK